MSDIPQPETAGASPGILASYPSLADQPVLVTGGATGIGEEVVRGFVRQRGKVAFIDLQAEAGKKLAAKTGALFIECDLHDVPALQKAVAEAARQVGDITVLVNNAAHDERHAWQEVTEQYWDERLAINLKHVFFATQAVAPMMVAAGKGSIVNFGSSAWMLAEGNMPGYTSAKAAIHGLTRSFARDLGKHNVRVNTVVPGWAMTRRQIEKWLTPESELEMKRRICLPHALQPAEVANMVLWLASDDSSACSAQNFIVDCGRL